MSAAAMAVPKNWESSGWTKTPRAFFKKLFRVFSQVELGVLGNILDDSVGRRGEADWVEVREPELARLVNCHVNSVGAALDKLEALSAIEARKSPRDKRVKQYRVLIHNWAKITEREARKLDRKGPGTAGVVESAEVDAALDDRPQKAALTVIQAKVPMVTLPGAKQPVPLAEACPHGSECELVQRYAKGAANARRRPHDPPRLNGEITTVDCGDSRPALNGDFHRFQRFVAQALTKRLNAPPPDRLVEELYRRLEQERVPYETFVLRFGLRERAVKSYGFLRCIVDDCVAAANQARQLVGGEAKRISGAEVERVQREARRAAAALKDRGGFDEAVKLLEETAKIAGTLAADPERFELHLMNLDDLLVTAAVERLPRSDVAKADAEAAENWPNHAVMRQFARECALRRLLIGCDGLVTGAAR